MSHGPANSFPCPTDRGPRSAPSPLRNAPLTDSDRAILRALLAPGNQPGAGGETINPHSALLHRSVAASLPTALAAAGLDELDLPLWFAQPHIQDYIAAHRALEDFLDEHASRAAKLEGLELLRSLARTADSPVQQRLIASALLRGCPALRAASRRSGAARVRATSSLTDPAPARGSRAASRAPRTASSLNERAVAITPAPHDSAPRAETPERPPQPRAHLPRPETVPIRPDLSHPHTRAEPASESPSSPPCSPDDDPSQDHLNQLLPDDMHDAPLEEVLAWAVSILSDRPDPSPDPSPDPARGTTPRAPPDTS